MDLEVIDKKLDYLINNLTERKEVYTAAEASQFLNVSYDYLMDRVRTGEIKHKRKGSGINSPVIFRREWLIEWLEN